MDKQFTPVMSDEDRHSKYDGWKKAVERSKGWEDPKSIIIYIQKNIDNVFLYDIIKSITTE